jgi:hypothetical protein
MTLLPNCEMMHRHLEWLTIGGPLQYRFEIAWGPPDQGPIRASTYRLDDVATAVSAATELNSAGNNVYVGVTLKDAETPACGRTGNEHAAMATSLALDFDNDFISGAQRLGVISPPQHLLITGTQPKLRGQLWVPLTRTFNLKVWDHANRELAAYCEADLNAVGVNRLMRLPGTISYPNTVKRSRGYCVEVTKLISRESKRFTIAEILQNLPARSVVAQAIPQRQARDLPANTTNVIIIMSALDALPIEFADTYRLWLSVGFALHDWNSGPVGLALWKALSNRCRLKADRTDFDRRWSRFGRSRSPERITLGTLLHHARKAGWSPPTSWDRLTQVS